MWPFRSKEDARRAASKQYVARIQVASSMVKERWLQFLAETPFKHDVPLSERIGFFIEPMIRGLRIAYPDLHASPDEAMLYLIIKGIVLSESHSEDELRQAFRSLGLEL